MSADRSVVPVEGSVRQRGVRVVASSEITDHAAPRLPAGARSGGHEPYPCREAHATSGRHEDRYIAHFVRNRAAIDTSLLLNDSMFLAVYTIGAVGFWPRAKFAYFEYA